MDFDELRDILRQSNNIVFLGGAGTSTESGIPDFRSENGLLDFKMGNEYTPEEILSHEFFIERTKYFYDFYKKKMIYKDALPNPAHHALVTLEKQGQLKAVITQNIDGLHQQAGSQNVLELHGSVHRNHCMKCRAFFPLDFILQTNHPVPKCNQCGGIIKPDVVLYQESLDNEIMSRATDYIGSAEVLIVAGTSLTVYPAAGLIRNYTGDKLIIINKSATPFDGFANYIIPDSIGKVLRNFVNE